MRVAARRGGSRLAEVARRVVGAALMLAGCTGHELDGGEPVAPAEVERSGPRRSCRSTVAAYQAPLERPGAQATIGERTFSGAWRMKGSEVEVVIVSLDARGGLVVTPVPVPYAAPAAIGVDAGGLWIVSVPLRGKGTLLRVAFAKDGSLRPGAPVPLPEVAWGWPDMLTSDGKRAELVHTLATEQQSAGAKVVYTIDLATQTVVATAAAEPGERRICEAGGCTTVALTRLDDHYGRLRVAGPGGAAEVTLESTCAASYVIEGQGERVVVAPGDPWRAIAAGPTRVAEVRVDRGLPREACGPALYEFPSRQFPGVIEGVLPRSLRRWDPRRQVFGGREALPDAGYDRTIRVEHPDGVIEVGWKGGHGLAHDPEHDPEGQRIYFEHWSFDGGAAKLLRREQDRWDAVDAAKLPVANVHGTMHEGYQPVVLRNGLHAAVLVVPMGGSEPAWVMPYLAPCGR